LVLQGLLVFKAPSAGKVQRVLLAQTEQRAQQVSRVRWVLQAQQELPAQTVQQALLVLV
jgi:hypothetical protein